jgi:hypothetical protein
MVYLVALMQDGATTLFYGTRRVGVTKKVKNKNKRINGVP